MVSFWTKPRRVFFTWGAVEVVGWLATHFWPDPGVNYVWLALVVIGLIPMYLYMPLKVKKMRNIFALWAVVVVLGMAASFAAFEWSPLLWLPPYLGVFWLVLMGAGFLVNALWWTPNLFLLGGGLQIVAGAATAAVPALLIYQYIVAAVVGSGAMFLLMAKRGAK